MWRLPPYLISLSLRKDIPITTTRQECGRSIYNSILPNITLLRYCSPRISAPPPPRLVQMPSWGTFCISPIVYVIIKAAALRFPQCFLLKLPKVHCYSIHHVDVSALLTSGFTLCLWPLLKPLRVCCPTLRLTP